MCDDTACWHDTDAWLQYEDAIGRCCICGKPTTELWDDREDCPVCDNPKCQFMIVKDLEDRDSAGDR